MVRDERSGRPASGSPEDADIDRPAVTAASRAGRPPRRPRRDAEENRERLLAAAAAAIVREGPAVPLATIAADAGVGIGTLYRSYADRDALLRALQFRAYGLLNGILDDIEQQDLHGLDSIGEFLARVLTIGDQLVLPLHGAPPLVSIEAVEARRAIYRRLDGFLERGRAEHGIRAPATATDIIVFSSLTTQPLPHGPAWHHMATRQVAIFLNGLAGSGPIEVPAPAPEQRDVERAFALAARQNSP